MDVSVAAAEELLVAKKRVVRKMAWSQRLERSNPQWFGFETALENEHGVVLEGVLLRAQWSPAVGVRPEATSLGLFLGNARVYAIDVKPWQKHKNSNAGRGRPKYGQVISGVHEHTWSEDGYGYAEELEVPDIGDVAVAWFEFLRRAKIDFPYEFVHPNPKFQPGQQEFDV